MRGMDRSPYQQLRQVEFLVQGWRPHADASRGAHKAYDGLYRRVQLTTAVLRDYELSESEEDTRAQLRTLPKAVKSLEQLRESVLYASEYDLIGVVDVAQLTSQLDELIDRLR